MKKVRERKELWCFLGCSFSCSGSKRHSPSGCYSWLWSSCPSHFTTVIHTQKLAFSFLSYEGPITSSNSAPWWRKLPHILLWLFYHMSITLLGPWGQRSHRFGQHCVLMLSTLAERMNAKLSEQQQAEAMLSPTHYYKQPKTIHKEPCWE